MPYPCLALADIASLSSSLIINTLLQSIKFISMVSLDREGYESYLFQVGEVCLSSSLRQAHKPIILLFQAA
jgi:hypothetical protein